jgi:hypothetical protein
MENECSFLKFMDDEEIAGIAIVHMDMIQTKCKRIKIIHVSTIDENKYGFYL